MLYILPWEVYGTQGNPLTFALQSVKAPLIVILSVSGTAIIATVTVTLSTIIATVRTIKQMAKDELIPKGISKDKLVVLITASIMIASLALGNVEVIGLVSNFGTVFSYITTAIAVVISRRRGIKGKFSPPLYPWLQILSIILSLLVMLSLGEESLILGVLLIIIGIIIHQIHVQINIVEKGKSLKPHGELP
jgi:hypothetical protein